MIKLRVFDKRYNKYLPQHTTDNMILYALNSNDYIIEIATGFTDKNGKDIYVGDIIEREDGRRDYVVFEDGEMTTKVEGWTFSYLIHYREENVKVIGNINENKELLK